MPDQLPPMCPQCGRRPQDSTTTIRTQWEAQAEELCPLCVRHWAKTGPQKVGTRCAGCARSTTALKAGICARCTKARITVLTLFDDEY
jgi:hypothetical protein